MSHSGACSAKLDDKATKVKSIKEWVDYPLMICDNKQNPLNTSNEIIIENEFFSGKGLLLINGLPNSPEYFVGKKRKFEYIVQGRFLNQLSFANVYTGHAFLKPLSMHPPQWLTAALMPIINYFQPAAEVKLDGPSPYILSPIMSTMQSIVVSKPGEEPSLTDLLNSEDNLSLIDSKVFKNMPSCTRKSYFSNQENLKKYNFDPNYIYSFVFYQHVLNIATFNLEMAFFQYDILNVIGCQPVQCLAVIWNPQDEIGGLPSSKSKSTFSSWKSNNSNNPSATSASNISATNTTTSNTNVNNGCKTTNNENGLNYNDNNSNNNKSTDNTDNNVKSTSSIEELQSGRRRSKNEKDDDTMTKNSHSHTKTTADDFSSSTSSQVQQQQQQQQQQLEQCHHHSSESDMSTDSTDSYKTAVSENNNRESADNNNNNNSSHSGSSNSNNNNSSSIRNSNNNSNSNNSSIRNSSNNESSKTDSSASPIIDLNTVIISSTSPAASTTTSPATSTTTSPATSATTTTPATTAAAIVEKNSTPLSSSRSQEWSHLYDIQVWHERSLR